MSAATTPLPLIAHVVFRFDVGGLENGLINLLNRLPRERYRHVVVALTDVRDFARRVARDDVRFVALNKGPGHGWTLWPRLVRLFRELRPTIVHTRNIAALEASLPAALAGVPVRIHGEHGWDVADVGRDNWRHRLTRHAYRPFVSNYVAVSREIEAYLAETLGVDRERIVRIVNGVDTQRFSPAGGGRVPIAGCPFEGSRLWLVGTVGRFAAVKDQVTLVRAFALARRSGDARRAQMRLILVGEGADRARIERVVADEKVGHVTWFTGARSDVAAILRGLDCFVLPSLAEGISNTILEAMASGLPIVATDVGGNRELIEDAVSGTLVPAADVAALAAAIGAFADQPPRARQLGDAARRAAVERFGIDRMVAEYGALYDRCLARPAMAAMSAARS